MANSVRDRLLAKTAKKQETPASAPAPVVAEPKKASFFNFKPIESEIPSEEKAEEEEVENEENN